MAPPVKSYAAHSPTGRLGLFKLERRSPRADDDVIEILYCGVCHSDVHNVRNDRGHAQQQYGENGRTDTCNGTDRVDGSRTQGGCSEQIVVSQDFVLKVPDDLDPAGAAPLLCAGITTWSPLRHWNVGPGSRVAIVGLGAEVTT